MPAKGALEGQLVGTCYSSGESNGGLDFGRGRKKWKEVEWKGLISGK